MFILGENLILWIFFKISIMTKYLFKCLNVIVKVGEWAMVNREKEAGLTMLAMAN